jgi:hypothetical protein
MVSALTANHRAAHRYRTVTGLAVGFEVVVAALD